MDHQITNEGDYESSSDFYAVRHPLSLSLSLSLIFLYILQIGDSVKFPTAEKTDNGKLIILINILCMEKYQLNWFKSLPLILYTYL